MGSVALSSRVSRRHLPLAPRWPNRAARTSRLPLVEDANDLKPVRLGVRIAIKTHA